MLGLTVEDLTRIFSGHLNRDRIPLTLIAFWDGQPAGTASIYVHDLEARPDLSPWLARALLHPLGVVGAGAGRILESDRGGHG